MYSLGCTLFLLLTGRTPYSGEKYRNIPLKMRGHCYDPIPDLIAARQSAVSWTPSSDVSSSPSSIDAKAKNKGRTDEGVHPTAVIPAELNAIYRKLLAKKPKDRFASAAELIAAITPFTRAQGDTSQSGVLKTGAVSKAVGWTPSSDLSSRPSTDAKAKNEDRTDEGVHPTNNIPAEAIADTSTWTPDQSPPQGTNTAMPQMLVEPEQKPRGQQSEANPFDWLNLPAADSPRPGRNNKNRNKKSSNSNGRGVLPTVVKLAVGAVALATLLAVYVFTVKTPEGELVIHSDAAGISVKVRSDGEEVLKEWKIVKGDDNKQLIRTGKIEIELPAEFSGEFNVTPNTVTLVKGKQEIVKIERKELPLPATKAKAPHVALTMEGAALTGPARDRQVAEWVLKQGWTCFIRDLESAKNVWLKPGDALPVGPIALYAVQGNETMKNADLENLTGLHEITQLNLMSPSIDHGAIPHVARLKSLLAISCYQTSIRTSALTKLHELPFLTQLGIRGEQVDDKWAFLGSLDSAWLLTVGNHVPNNEDFAAWASFPQLHNLHFDTADPVDAASVIEFQRKHPGCRIVTAYPQKPQVLGTDPVRQTILQLLPKGIEFEILLNNQTETRRVTQAAPNVPPEGQDFYFREVHLPRESPLTKEDLLPLANCSFDTLYAQGRKQAEALLQSLPPRLAVYAYNLSGSDVTDEGLKHLHGTSWLKNLDITGTQVTADGVKMFHTKNPHCEINSNFGLISPNWSAPKPQRK